MTLTAEETQFVEFLQSFPQFYKEAHKIAEIEVINTYREKPVKTHKSLSLEVRGKEVKALRLGSW